MYCNFTGSGAQMYWVFVRIVNTLNWIWLWMHWFIRKSSKIDDQHSRFPSSLGKTLGLRAIRVSCSCLSQEWIFPQLFHHFFLVQKLRGCVFLLFHAVMATRVDWAVVSLCLILDSEATLEEHKLGGMHVFSSGWGSIACRGKEDWPLTHQKHQKCYQAG